MDKKIQSILDLENKERFRRRLLISSRVIGILLVLSIFWIGFIQIQYVNKINQIKAEYGPLAYCYLCGLENGRSCSCNYLPDLIMDDLDRKSFFTNIAFSNVVPCEDRNSKKDVDNLSNIILFK